MSLLTARTLEDFLFEKLDGAALGSSMWKTFQLLPPTSVIDPGSGHRMLAMTKHEISTGWFATTGRYVIWLNVSTLRSEEEPEVWSEWQPEAAVAALFEQNGVHLPHAGVWHSPGGSMLSSGKLYQFLGLVAMPLVLAGSFAFAIHRRRLSSDSRARRVSHCQLRRSLTAVLEQAGAFLTPADVANARELIHHGEFGVVLELICTQLEEYGASIPVPLLSRIQHAGARMRLPASTWEGLTVASITSNSSPP